MLQHLLIYELKFAILLIIFHLFFTGSVTYISAKNRTTSHTSPHPQNQQYELNDKLLSLT